jgi:hypothetical protein
MRKGVVLLVALASSAGWLAACGDDTMVAPPDGGKDASMTGPLDGSYPPFDAGNFVDNAAPPDTGSGDAGADGDATVAPPARLLLSYNGGTQSELVAFGMTSMAVDGRLTFPGFIGGAYVNASAPWLLEQSQDVVAKLDGAHPWMPGSSWNVALSDFSDAGFSSGYSDPIAVVPAGGTKVYVLRYTRNEIAVIDASQAADAGTPGKTIDLSGVVETGGDGYVEMNGGFYDATTKRVYVLLANIDRFNVGCGGYCLVCSNTHPALVAIDTTTDALVPLGDAGTAGYALAGYDPAFGPGGMVYDAAGHRAIVLESGCNQAASDGGVGPITRRVIEAVDLTTGGVTQLLDLNAQPFPSALFYLDTHDAIVQLDTAYAWDPTTTTLGAAIPNAPDTFDVDGQGNLVGLKTQYGADGGVTGIDVVSVKRTDGTVTKLGSNPFSMSGGFVGGVALWPPAH